MPISVLPGEGVDRQPRFGAQSSTLNLENFIHLQQVRSRCCYPMRGQAERIKQSGRTVSFWMVGGSDRMAKKGSAHNDTSALHASLHGAATRDPRGGETPMMRLNLPQLAECPASRGMRSNMDV